jgi:hypothetical protein
MENVSGADIFLEDENEEIYIDLVRGWPNRGSVWSSLGAASNLLLSPMGQHEMSITWRHPLSFPPVHTYATPFIEAIM